MKLIKKSIKNGLKQKFQVVKIAEKLKIIATIQIQLILILPMRYFNFKVAVLIIIQFITIDFTMTIGNSLQSKHTCSFAITSFSGKIKDMIDCISYPFTNQTPSQKR